MNQKRSTKHIYTGQKQHGPFSKWKFNHKTFFMWIIICQRLWKFLSLPGYLLSHLKKIHYLSKISSVFYAYWLFSNLLEFEILAFVVDSLAWPWVMLKPAIVQVSNRNTEQKQQQNRFFIVIFIFFFLIKTLLRKVKPANRLIVLEQFEVFPPQYFFYV